MMAALHLLHWIAGFIVLAEALNKLERTCPAAPGLTTHQRVVDGLKALAWTLLAIGSAGAVALPILSGLGVQFKALPGMLHQEPSLAETTILLGFAVLIIRTRVKEG